MENGPQMEPRSSVNVGCRVLGEFIDDALAGSEEPASVGTRGEVRELAPSAGWGSADEGKSPRALWLQVIKRHTTSEPGGQLLKVGQRDRSTQGSVMIHCSCEDERRQSTIEGEQLDATSDEYPVIHHQSRLPSSLGKYTTYVRWRDILSITFREVERQETSGEALVRI